MAGTMALVFVLSVFGVVLAELKAGAGAIGKEGSVPPLPVPYGALELSLGQRAVFVAGRRVKVAGVVLWRATRTSMVLSRVQDLRGV